jgi:hypothetical protein
VQGRLCYASAARPGPRGRRITRSAPATRRQTRPSALSFLLALLHVERCSIDNAPRASEGVAGVRRQSHLCICGAFDVLPPLVIRPWEFRGQRSIFCARNFQLFRASLSVPECSCRMCCPSFHGRGCPSQSPETSHQHRDVHMQISSRPALQERMRCQDCSRVETTSLSDWISVLPSAVLDGGRVWPRPVSCFAVVSTQTCAPHREPPSWSRLLLHHTSPS